MPRFLSWMRDVADFARVLGRSAAHTARTLSPAGWIGLAVGLVGLIAAVALLDVPTISAMRAWAEATGPWFVFVFCALYVAFTQVPLPRTIWTVASGVLFGPVVGLALSLLSLTVSAALSFSAVRWLLGDWMRPHLAHPAVAGISSRLQQRGWLAVGSLRLVAGVPFCVVNYAAALTPIRLHHFLLATLFGSVPTTALGVFVGDALSGSAHPWVYAALVASALVGIIGLAVDARTPTSPDVKYEK